MFSTLHWLYINSRSKMCNTCELSSLLITDHVSDPGRASVVRCVCLCVQAITFIVIKPIYLIYWFILGVSRSNSKVKLRGQGGVFWRVAADLSLEDSGNYTCEVRGPKSSIMASVTHYIFIRGIYGVTEYFLVSTLYFKSDQDTVKLL